MTLVSLCLEHWYDLNMQGIKPWRANSGDQACPPLPLPWGGPSNSWTSQCPGCGTDPGRLWQAGLSLSCRVSIRFAILPRFI